MPRKLSVAEALELCVEISEQLEELEDVDAAEEFCDNVRTKSTGIEESIRKYGNCTENQGRALQNMSDGLARWIDNKH